MNVYPILLNDLSGRRCVVFGGDHEAERKALELREHGADVTVVYPALTPALQAAVDAGDVSWRARRYEAGDLADAFLTIVSCRYEGEKKPIWEEAQREKVLINAMDDVPHCSFVAGSVIRRGPLVVTISTSGCAPALSVRLRQRFEQEFGPEYGEFLEMMGALRTEMMRRFPDFETRRERWYRLVDSDILERLREEDRDGAARQVEAILAPAA
ncbi:MAG: bifunctional precorrin-2 dehydrogenase/sirohydrochlorin ferrochelatase [Rhodothermales bacterium]